METRYLYETFESEAADFDGKFTEFLNGRYDGGWKYKQCQFAYEGGTRRAHCVFKRD